MWACKNQIIGPREGGERVGGVIRENTSFTDLGCKEKMRESKREIASGKHKSQ
jgi:hypothetical protein